MNWTLQQVAHATGGRLRGEGSIALRGVSTDTRTLHPGALYVALSGERFDGHAFAEAARERGAHGALVSRAIAPCPLPCVEVPDTLAALADLARAARARFTGPVLAITGSNGKTTTKELCANILEAAGRRVRRTPGNLNNHIGVPLSILALEEDDEVLVIELGMNHPGEIDALARIARPHVGAITQVAAAHLGPMGSLEAIGRAKGELLERIEPEGCAVLNADDAQVALQAPRFAGRRVWFGTAAKADYRAEDVEGARFALITPRERTTLELALPGPHLMLDALCAAATAAESGLLGDAPAAPIRAGLESFRGLPGRLSLRRAPSGLRVLDDSYNANPTSVRAALATLGALRAPGTRSAVLLGDMLELGPEERALHAEIGRDVARAGVHALIGVGALAARAVCAAREAGIAVARAADSPEEAGQSARELLGPEDIALVKGSRGARMEGAVRILLEAAPAAEESAG